MAAKSIGWIGTGVMGKSMCKHLLSKGYKLMVFNRTKSKTDELVELGATYAEIPEIAKNVDLLFLMLGYPRDVEQVAFETHGGLINLMKPGSFLVDHTTSSPSLAARLAIEFLKKDIYVYDAPVSGGDIGARNGQLVTMCGGEKAHFETVAEVMRSYSKLVQLMGPAGAGQSTKLTNQIVIASSMIGVCEGLIFGYKSGLNLEEVLQVIGGGAASSFSLNAYTPRILKGDFAPGFFVDHFVKDMELVLEECARMNLQLPGLKLAHQLYSELKAEGGGQYGTQALIKVLEKLNNVSLG